MVATKRVQQGVEPGGILWNVVVSCADLFGRIDIRVVDELVAAVCQHLFNAFLRVLQMKLQAHVPVLLYLLHPGDNRLLL